MLQQSFTRAWVALRGGSEVGQPRPWLYRIVHNAAANAHRSARLRRHEPIESASPAVAAGDVETAVLARDTLRHVAALPQMQQRAVVMTAIEGRSHEEAAGVLGVSDGAVRGLVHRARTTLRAAAAALSPQGLLGLLSRAAGDGSIAERPVEAGAAGAGLAGLLSKGAAVTAVTGLLAGGAVVQLEHHRHAAGTGAPRDGRGRDGACATGAVVGFAAPAPAVNQVREPARREEELGGGRGASSGRHGERHRGERGRGDVSARSEDSSHRGQGDFNQIGSSREDPTGSGRRDGGETNRSTGRNGSGSGPHGGPGGGGSALLSGDGGGFGVSGDGIAGGGEVAGSGAAGTADEPVPQVDASPDGSGGPHGGSDQAVRNPG